MPADDDTKREKPMSAPEPTDDDGALADQALDRVAGGFVEGDPDRPVIAGGK